MKKILLSSLFLVFSCTSVQSSHENAALADKVILAVNQSAEEKASYEAAGTQFVIATQGQEATKAAQEIFAKGGNIIDAAVAASFVISVERPQSTGLGGGGFMLFREAKSGKTFAIDFRERAPLKATDKMFLNEKGEVVAGLSTEGHKAVAVPGLVAGLFDIHKKYGKLLRSTVMAAAIRLAEKGVLVYPHLANALKEQKNVLAKFPASAKIFLKKNAEPYVVGDLLVQKDLGKTLRALSKGGKDLFYKGSLAKAIAKESSKGGGLITIEDFKKYSVKWREPAKGTYKGYDIFSMPPPSSGGTHVIEIMNIVEGDSLKEWGSTSAKTIHVKAAAMQQAFADRATYMGDPDFFTEIPLKGLLSKKYAESVRKGISLESAKKSDSIKAGDPKNYESTETTNFSMMDSEGNVVVSTQTINGWLGSGVVVPGTGILLNNEMDDFSAKPGASNAYGAVGGIPNAIAPYKTPLSSMAPTIITKDNIPVLALGAPGGTRIITCVAETAINYLEHKMSLYDSVASLRMHHQWQPDKLDLETPGPGERSVKALESMGYKVNVDKIPCRVNAVSREGNILRGAADPRDLGSSFAR